MESPEMQEKIRELVDQLGQAFVHALATDEAGRNLLKQIHETGFHVGILLEATVALHQKKSEDTDSPADRCPFSVWGQYADEISNPENIKDFEWSEEDKAMLSHFRISLE